MAERALVYGPPKIALDTTLRLKAEERVLVDQTYTARPDRVTPTFRQYRCRWCGLPIEIQSADATRYSARALVAHARSRHVDE